MKDLEVLDLTVFTGQEKGLIALRHLAGKPGVRIKEVVVSLDKKVRSDFSTDISEFCNSMQISIAKRVDDPKTRFAIAVGFREMIEWPIGRLVVLHDSILPKYRGFAPVPTMLENGEKKMGVTAFIAETGYDTGDILASKSSKIRYPMKIKEALLLNHSNYIYCLDKALDKIRSSNGPLAGRKQNNRRATYSLWRDSVDYQINWSCDAERIVRFIDAVGDPYDGAQTQLSSRPVRITEARSVKAVRIENLAPGKVIWRSQTPRSSDSRPTVVCGLGLIEILEAHFMDTGESIFPLKSTRLRFEGKTAQ